MTTRYPSNRTAPRAKPDFRGKASNWKQFLHQAELNAIAGGGEGEGDASRRVIRQYPDRSAENVEWVRKHFERNPPKPQGFVISRKTAREFQRALRFGRKLVKPLNPFGLPAELFLPEAGENRPTFDPAGDFDVSPWQPIRLPGEPGGGPTKEDFEAAGWTYSEAADWSCFPSTQIYQGGPQWFQMNNAETQQGGQTTGCVDVSAVQAAEHVVDGSGDVLLHQTFNNASILQRRLALQDDDVVRYTDKDSAGWDADLQGPVRWPGETSPAEWRPAPFLEVPLASPAKFGSPHTQPSNPDPKRFRNPDMPTKVDVPLMPLPLIGFLPETVTQPSTSPLPVAPTQFISVSATNVVRSRAVKNRSRNRRPRGPERKVRMSAVGRFLWHMVNFVTESVDFLDALHDALPKRCRARSFKPQDKAAAVYKCFDHLDVAKAVENYLNNQFEDFIYGSIGRGAGMLNRLTGQVTGGGRALSFGGRFAMKADVEADFIPQLSFDAETGAWRIDTPFGFFGIDSAGRTFASG